VTRRRLRTRLQHKTLDDEKLGNALTGSIIRWVRAVRIIHRQIVIRDADTEGLLAFARLLALEEHLMKAYLLIMGLRQIAEHLEKLKRRPGYKTRRFKNAAKAFLREYKKEEIQACRHLLEHHADHLVGDGKYQDLVEEIELYGLRFGGRERENMPMAFYISVFGRHYPMDGIMVRVEELLVALDEPDPPVSMA